MSVGITVQASFHEGYSDEVYSHEEVRQRQVYQEQGANLVDTIHLTLFKLNTFTSY